MAVATAGSLVFDTQTDTSGFERGTRNINNQTEQLASSFNNVGKAIVAAFSIAAIKEFGTQLIEITATLQALDAQFDQVFKGEEGAKAMKVINQQSEDLGIHVNRLKESFNKFGAQVKGSGMDASKALEATKIATANAADAAAFYDVSLETASASVASFMKGNFEAGDAIGVFTSAAQMNVRANEMYSKSWDKLNEAERQWLLLDTISKTNELSGAAGQSKRETDNWENSVGNLKAAWEEFLSILGSSLLSNTVVVVQNITNALSALTTFMQNNTSTIDNFKLAIEGLTVALATYFIVINRSMIMYQLIALWINAEIAIRKFGIALASPAGQMALLAGAIVLLIGLTVRLQDSWGKMEGWQKVVAAIGGITAAALIGAMAVGTFQAAMTRGLAAAGIVAGIAAMAIAISAAESKVRAASKAATNGSGLPHLASGAVIPPNGEFMAVLGDQKHGKNLEAPEGLIRQIMRDELSKNGGGGGNGTATAVFNIDGREFARAMAPYNTGENMRQGTRLINGVT